MRRVGKGFLVGLLLWPFLIQIAHADPLDDARAQAMSFIQRAGVGITGLAVGVGSLAIAVVAIRRKIDIATGSTENLARHNKEIIDILKLLAWVGASGLAASIAGSVFK